MYHRKCGVNIPQEIISLYTKEGESLVHFVMCRDGRHNLIMCRWTKLTTHADQALVFLTTEGDHRVLPQSGLPHNKILARLCITHEVFCMYLSLVQGSI